MELTDFISIFQKIYDIILVGIEQFINITFIRENVLCLWSLDGDFPNITVVGRKIKEGILWISDEFFNLWVHLKNVFLLHTFQINLK